MRFSADFFSLRFFGVGGRPGGTAGSSQTRRGHRRRRRKAAWDMAFRHRGGGKQPAEQTRLLTRHLEEVWFPGHACHALVASLFASLFAGKREVPPRRGRREALARPGAAGAFYFSPPKAKIPADLATQGQSWHLFTTRGGFGLHPEAPRLFVLHDLGPKPLKRGEWGQKASL